MAHLLKSSVQASALLFAALLASSCDRKEVPAIQYAPEMYEPIPYEPLKQKNVNLINPMGINQRVPVVGTVPLGKLDYYNHIPKDSVGIAERTLRNPYAYNKQNLEEGKALYTRVCAHCHGEQGDGQGPVGIKFKGVPNYAAGAYKTMNDGHIYHVIQWGRNRMMPHGSIVNPEERWKIAMYVRVLQRGEGPDGLAALVDVSQDSSQMTDRTNQSPILKAQADKASATPGYGGTEARNGTAN